MAHADRVGVWIAEQIERMLAGHVEILGTVLVMDRERFGGLAPQRRRATRQRRQLLPRLRRLIRAPVAAANPGETAKRFGVDFGIGADAPGKVDRLEQRRLGVLVL